MKEYALYKGEELLINGSLNEIADHQNVKKSTIQFYGCDSYMKRIEKTANENRKVLVEL